MFLRSWRALRSIPATRVPSIRPYTAGKPPASSATQPSPAASSISRFEARLPRVLRHVTTPLHNAPVSHITAFLILHEITAIVPLLGLAALFHYTDYLPRSFSESQWMQEGTERFARYLRKKGWITQEEANASVDGSGSEQDMAGGGMGMRVVVELATAYAITKAMLPLRLLVSVWGTPWFARWTVMPVMNVMQRVLGRGKGAKGVGLK